MFFCDIVNKLALKYLFPAKNRTQMYETRLIFRENENCCEYTKCKSFFTVIAIRVEGMSEMFTLFGTVFIYSACSFLFRFLC